jgi:D-glycero-alpha-D-manno-heptose 1-phosphate guanylyltransferase
MASVVGRPFLEHLLDYWISQGVERFVLCVEYLSESISNHFGNDYEGSSIEYSVDQGELGTGGAISLALSRFPQSGNFLVLNGDTYFPIPIPELEVGLRNTTSDWVIGLFSSTDLGRFTPVRTDTTDRVREIGPSMGNSDFGAEKDFLVNGGVYLAKGTSFGEASKSLQVPFSVEQGLMRLIETDKTRVLGLRFGVDFLDIGTPDDLARAQTMPDFQT